MPLLVSSMMSWLGVKSHPQLLQYTYQEHIDRKMAETLTLRGELKAHRGWVTAIAPPLDPNSDVLLTSSRYVLLISYNIC